MNEPVSTEQLRRMDAYWRLASALLLAATIVAQVLATLIVVYRLFMIPIRWRWALLVWGVRAREVPRQRLRQAPCLSDLRSARGLRSRTRA